MRILKGLVICFFFQIIVLCIVLSFRFVNSETTGVLVVFNLFFITLTIQLSGSLNKKLCLLSIGNIIGLLWNYIFCTLILLGTDSFGKIFNTIYIIFFPFLNSLWLVSFWSLSLTIFQDVKNDVRKINYDL
jgi:hypothetical protein